MWAVVRSVAGCVSGHSYSSYFFLYWTINLRKKGDRREQLTLFLVKRGVKEVRLAYHRFDACISVEYFHSSGEPTLAKMVV